MAFLISILMAAFMSSICYCTNLTLWTKIMVDDFPTDPPIFELNTGRSLVCTILANRNINTNLYCFDGAISKCAMYRLPVLKQRYICNAEINSCEQGDIICYQKPVPEDAYIGLDIEPFTGADADNGTISAKNIFNIPMEREYEWNLPPGKIMKLTITAFDIGDCCSCASLEFLDANTNANLRGPFCGPNAVPFEVVIPSRKFKLKFVTDGSKKLPGFELGYESIEAFFCDSTVQEINDTSLEVSASNIYSEPMICLWRTNMAPGSILKITFTAFDFGSCAGGAYMVITDFAYTAIPLTGGSICGTTIPNPIRATMSNDIEIKFETSGAATLPGFTLQLEVMPMPTLTDCVNGIVLTAPSGVIRPSYPNYSNDLTCDWTIQVAIGSKVGLYFSWFKTEPDFDEVRITDTATNSFLGGGPLSGYVAVPPLQSSSNEVQVQFTTDDSIRDEGFYLYYYTI